MAQGQSSLVDLVSNFQNIFERAVRIIKQTGASELGGVVEIPQGEVIPSNFQVAAAYDGRLCEDDLLERPFSGEIHVLENGERMLQRRWGVGPPVFGPGGRR